jgi:hypothetical protein
MRYLSSFFKGLLGFFTHLPEILLRLLRLPKQLWLLIVYICRGCLRGLKPRPRCKNEIDLPPDVHKRADPMLYSQFWLMSMGVAVTWDNPDIQLYRANVPVSSDLLEKDTVYEVRVRVWNNAYDAPAPGLPVHLTYYGFGAGPDGTYLGKRIIDLGAKGTSQCPAFASFIWKTPTTEGHYCLRAFLEWPDDANPNNNLGQENTNVGMMQSPALFEFKAKNNASVRRKFTYEVDDYRLPDLDPCDRQTDDNRKPQSRLRESRARWDKTLAGQGYGKFTGWASDWEVKIEPEKETLNAGEEIRVRVSIESKKPGFKGRKPFNIHVFGAPEHENARREFVGGVTLYVEK